jgi:prevent-host-death family protein
MNEHSRIWSLQEAKAKFSEVVRLAQSNGPQTVTVHGKPAAVISSPEHAMHRAPTIDEIVTGFQACPAKDFDIPRNHASSKFRDVEL